MKDVSRHWACISGEEGHRISEHARRPYGPDCFAKSLNPPVGLCRGLLDTDTPDRLHLHIPTEGFHATLQGHLPAGLGKDTGKSLIIWQRDDDEAPLSVDPFAPVKEDSPPSDRSWSCPCFGLPQAETLHVHSVISHGFRTGYGFLQRRSPFRYPWSRVFPGCDC
jgi:hypothetical protein